MSGICAVWRKENPERVAATLNSALGGLSLLEPEVATQEICGAAGAGVSARFATQQIYRNGHTVVACDAELFNEKELAELAGLQPPAAEGSGRAALLAALYERYGCDFVKRLRGGFAVVLWDRREKRLLAAIDGFGIKRLVYADNARIFLAASRIESLVRTGEIDTGINPKAIANVLNFSSNLAPETIFTRIHRLIPGALLVVSDRGARIQKYWDMHYVVGDEDADEARLSAEVESTVESSVAAYCKDDPLNELGAFLSGGTDSSTVVGMITRARRAPVKAFSIGFEEQPFNELSYAEIAAKQFGSEHHTYMVGARDCFDAFPAMVRGFDEPFGNSSAIPTYFCARLAAENGVKTLLAGDGGDELFGGNERYATEQVFEVYRKVPKVLRTAFIEPVCAWLPQHGLLRRAGGYIRRANLPGVERMLSFQFLQTHSPAEVFTADFLNALGSYTVGEVPARHYAQAQARDHLDRLLYVDVKITLADSDLPKVTCMSELAGIQVRFPFLDRSVAELSGRIPARLKVKGFEKRYLFKRAFRQLLPPEILNKPKHGFGIPIANWMRSDKRMRELSYDTLLSARAFGRGYFRRDFVEDVFRKHEAENRTGYYGDTIWTFLALELWHRQMVDQPVGMSV
jgi:asparagine synthase (glutamine-hydrolysing)